VPWIGAVLASPYISSLRSLHPFLFCSWLADPDITLSGAPQHYKLAKDPSTNMADSDSPHIMTEGQITRSAPKASQTAVLRPANQSLAFSSPLFVSSRPKIMKKKHIDTQPICRTVYQGRPPHWQTPRLFKESASGRNAMTRFPQVMSQLQNMEGARYCAFLLRCVFIFVPGEGRCRLILRRGTSAID